jgi:hypothetical protein
MSIEGFEVVGIDEFRSMVNELKKKIKGRLDKVSALEEASEVVGYLAEKGFKASPIEVEEDMPPIYKIDLERAIVYLIIYPRNYDLLAGEAARVAAYILFGPPAREDEGKYIVLIFFTRHGKLGPAAYLYLGMLIENYGIGVLFVNGSEAEVHEILESLRKSGRYEPPEEEAVPL